MTINLTTKAKKRNLSLVLGLIFLMPALWSCDSNKCLDAPEVSVMGTEVEVVRLDSLLGSISSKEDLINIYKKYPSFFEFMLQREKYFEDSLFFGYFFQRYNNPGMDTLYWDVRKQFSDFSYQEEQLAEAFSRIKYHYPDFTPPKVMTGFTGFQNDLYISDSLIIIGLDYYLGEDARYRPRDPGYILKRYQAEYMVPQLMVILSSFYNEVDGKDKTLLADMIYYGKAYYFAQNMLPCVPDSIFTGYTSEETEDVDKFEKVIWANFITNELLFETTHRKKIKFLEERPVTTEIGEKCPGRIGRWVGWRIVNKYHQKSGANLVEIMAEPDANKIFSVSKYKPE